MRDLFTRTFGCYRKLALLERMDARYAPNGSATCRIVGFTKGKLTQFELTHRHDVTAERESTVLYHLVRSAIPEGWDRSIPASMVGAYLLRPLRYVRPPAHGRSGVTCVSLNRLKLGPESGRLGGLKNVAVKTQGKRTAHAQGWRPKSCTYCNEERPLKACRLLAGDEQLMLCASCRIEMRSEVVP